MGETLPEFSDILALVIKSTPKYALVFFIMPSGAIQLRIPAKESANTMSCGSKPFELACLAFCRSTNTNRCRVLAKSACISTKRKLPTSITAWKCVHFEEKHNKEKTLRSIVLKQGVRVKKEHSGLLWRNTTNWGKYQVTISLRSNTNFKCAQVCLEDIWRKNSCASLQFIEVYTLNTETLD